MDKPLDESAWRRGWEDTKKAWKSIPFIILDAVVCVVVGSVFEWYWGLGLFLFAMLCTWIGATASAPIKQRNENRASLIDLKRKLTDAGYIEAFRFDAIELRDKLRYWKAQGLVIDDHELQQYQEWFGAVSSYL
jgi:hypothetical protein